MLDVADYERIRRRGRIEGKTQRQAADELGHSRNMYLLRLELTVVSYPTAAGFDVFTATWSKRFS